MSKITDTEAKAYWRGRRMKFRRKYGREMTFDDMFTPLGQSQDTGRRNPQSGSQNDGIVKDT